MSTMSRAPAELLLFLMVFAACSGSTLPEPGAGADGDVGGDSDGHEERDGDEDAGDGDVEETEDDADGEDGSGCDDSTASLSVEAGQLELGVRREALNLERCTQHVLSYRANQGSRIAVELRTDGLFALELTVTYPDLSEWEMGLGTVRTEVVGEAVSLEISTSRSGEYLLLVRSTVPEVGQSYDVEVRCVEGCEGEATRYPILLVHGWTGFDQIGPIEYFYNIPETLRDLGYWVAVAQLDPYNAVEVRAEQLALQVDEALRLARARRVNLIAHSQGGLDSRYLISTLGYGERVSSLTTIATPHRGTPLCDVALGLLPGAGEAVLSGLLNLVGASVMGSESDALASFWAMTEDGVQNLFNPSNPDDPEVTYISWTGRTCLYGVGCDDICDVEIRWSYDIIYLLAGENDGIVPVSSASWGDYRGEIPADHFDEVGQLFGVTGPSFDHEEFYIERARDLAREGH